MLILIKNLVIKIGYVYILYYPREGLTKIGRTSEPIQRFISIYNSLPGFIFPIGVFPVLKYKTVERILKKDTSRFKKKPRNAGPAAGASEFRKLPLKHIIWIWFSCFIEFTIYFLIELLFLFLLYCLLHNNNFLINLKSFFV